jgi:hypothetical protein
MRTNYLYQMTAVGFLLFYVCWLAIPANAGLILNPAGTLIIQASPIPDEARVQLTSSLVNGVGSFSGKFFGETKSDIYVSENGHLVFAAVAVGEADFFPAPLGSTRGSIAPLWDDFLLVQSTVNPMNAVLAEYSAGQYLSVSWQNVRLELETTGGLPFPDTNRTAQVVWFEGDASIRGFEFKKDDLAFGYIPHTAGTDFGDIAAVAGLDKGDGTFSAVQGTTDGSLNSTQGHRLAPGENEFLLFRPGEVGTVPFGFAGDSFQGGYYRGRFSLTAVPEPSSIGLCMAVAIAAVVSYRRQINRSFGSWRHLC